MAITLGLDTSSHQDPSPRTPAGDIDWAQVARTPYRFAVVRMTIGKTTRDQTGRRDLRGALDHLPVAGAYGVVGTAEPVEAGARLLLEEIAAAGADPRRVLVMLDAENFIDGSHPTIDQVDRYARTLHDQLGRWPVAYIPDWWLDGHGYSVRGRGLANCPWAPSEYFPAPWTEARLLARKPTSLHGFKSLAWLQYTSSASAAGIVGRVDANCYYGTITQLRAQLLGGQPEEETLATLTDAEKNELMRAVDNINHAVGFGQTSFEGTVEAILRNTQGLTNIVKQAQGALAGNIADVRSAILGAIAALPAPGEQIDAEALAARIVEALSQAGVQLDPNAVLDALHQRLAA